jgi:hypothetical protein
MPRRLERAFAVVPARVRQWLVISERRSLEESPRFCWNSSAADLNAADCHVYGGNLAQSRMRATRGTLRRSHGSLPNFSRYAALEVSFNGALRAPHILA